MSAQGTFKLSAYCICGGSMVGSGAGEMSAVDELQTVWWSVHSGDGHGPTDQAGAAKARRQAARQLDADIRNANRRGEVG